MDMDFGWVRNRQRLAPAEPQSAANDDSQQQKGQSGQVEKSTGLQRPGRSDRGRGRPAQREDKQALRERQPDIPAERRLFQTDRLCRLRRQHWQHAEELFRHPS